MHKFRNNFRNRKSVLKVLNSSTTKLLSFTTVQRANKNRKDYVSNCL